VLKKQKARRKANLFSPENGDFICQRPGKTTLISHA
jgi:hypothetical protein